MSERALMIGDVVADKEGNQFIVQQFHDGENVSLKTIGVGFTVHRQLHELTFIREAHDEEIGSE